MTALMDDVEVIERIKQYQDHNYIWIEIWEIDRYEIQLVVIINNEKMIVSDHKVLRVTSLFIDEESPELIKERGRELKKLLKKLFKSSEIHSNLHYR